MMPTFPPPPLRFRRVGFPQYGSKASLSAEACPGGDEVKPTPGMPSARPEFASRLRDAGRYRIGTPPVPAPKGNPARSSLPAPPLTPGVLGSGRVLLSRPSSLIRPHAPVSGAPRDFTTLRRFYSGPSLGGRAGSDPRDLPYFPCRAVPTCRGPYAGRLAPPLPLSRGDNHRLPRFRTEPPPTTPASASNTRRGPRFRRCILRFMLRPAGLPRPPGWLRRREPTPLPLPTEDFVTLAFGPMPHGTRLRVRLDWRTGNLQSSGLAPDQSRQVVRLHPKGRGYLERGV